MLKSKESDIRITNDYILKKIKTEKKDKSWLDHTGQAGGIDYGLLNGGTLEQLRIYSNSNSTKRVYNHILYLRKKYGLSISELKSKDNLTIYKFEYNPTNGEVKEEEDVSLNPSELNKQVYTEGKSNEVLVTQYERDSSARKKCIEHYGFSCSVCDFDFEKIYGEVGKGYVHVHHLNPVSTAGQGEINPINDLRPVCPNCHAMIHKRKKPFSIEEIKKMINVSKGN